METWLQLSHEIPALILFLSVNLHGPLALWCEGLQVSVGCTLRTMTFRVCPRSLQWWYCCTGTDGTSLDLLSRCAPWRKMSTGLTNVAYRAAWRREKISRPAFKHLLPWWLKWRQNCLEFSECHDSATRRIDFMKRTCIASTQCIFLYTGWIERLWQILRLTRLMTSP